MTRVLRFALLAYLLAGARLSYADDLDGPGDEGPETNEPPAGGDDKKDAGDGASGAEAEPGAWKKGQIGILVDVGINLSSDAVAKPFAIAPDITYVIGPKLRAVLGHSSMSGGGFYGLTGYRGHGLCLSGESNGCYKVYDNFNLGADYWAVKGGVNVQAWGRFNVDSLDAGFYGVTAGALISKALSGGKLMVGVNPNIYLGLNDRDFNQDRLTIPVHAMYAVSPKLMAGVQLGIAGPIDGFSDAFAGPLAVGGMFKVSPKLNVGAAFAFANLYGKNNTADARALSILVGYSM